MLYSITTQLIKKVEVRVCIFN